MKADNAAGGQAPASSELPTALGGQTGAGRARSPQTGAAELPTVLGSTSKPAAGDAGADPPTTMLRQQVAYLVRCQDGRRFALACPVVAGRGPTAGAGVASTTSVSRSHLRIVTCDDRYLVEDLGSKNGTALNGRRLAAHRLTEVVDGDVLMLGREEFAFVTDEG